MVFPAHMRGAREIQAAAEHCGEPRAMPPNACLISACPNRHICPGCCMIRAKPRNNFGECTREGCKISKHCGVSGNRGLCLVRPHYAIGGEKCTYQVPTYEALKGILSSVYRMPTLIWYIDAVRVMNPIQTEVKGVRPLKYRGAMTWPALSQALLPGA